MPRRRLEWRSGRPSLADVATAAGVSAQTVSRVVNGTSTVMPETRAKVEAALVQLGYRANTAARALATNRFGSIGVICFDMTRFGNLYIVDEAIRQARDHGYGVYLSSVPEPTRAHVQAAIRGLTDQAVDGLLIVEARILDTPNLDLPDLPVVVAEGVHNVPYATVGVDQGAGARLAVEHLLGLGHRTVHHISGLARSHPAARRRAAWERVLAEHGIPAPEPIAGDWSADSGYRAGLELLRSTAADEVTALFVANDQMAAGVLHAAAELGVRVPEQLSVVGYDDVDFAAHLFPPLTTVHQDMRTVGRRGTDLLIDAIQARTSPAAGAELIVPELIVRASTAPPAS